MNKFKLLATLLILGTAGLGLYLTQGQYQFSFQGKPSLRLSLPSGGALKNLFAWPVPFPQKQKSLQKTPKNLFVSPSPQSSENAPQTNQSNEQEKSKIRDYLIASSEIDFPEPWQISEVIALAYRGQKEHLKNLITVLKEKLEKFRALTPPSALENFHQESLQIMTNYIEFLTKAASALTPTEMTEVLNSRPFNNLRSQAQDLIANLRAFLSQYQIELPEEVLPEKSLPNQSPTE